MESYLALQGYEVWSVNLRGQGTCHQENSDHEFGLSELSLIDLPCVLDFISENSRRNGDALSVIGCSLGGAILFLSLAHNRAQQVRHVVGLGAPMKWRRVHPLVRLAFFSPQLAARIPTRGNRRILKALVPLLSRYPRLMHLYLHPEHSDLDRYDLLLRTVEDSSSTVNQELSIWMRAGDLSVGGVNVTEAVERLALPLLCVAARQDGVVPQQTAQSAFDCWGGDDKQFLLVGDEETPFAHADLFISRYSQERVFEPIADWLAGRQELQ